MNDNNCGLYDKFRVSRTDGSSEPGTKHHDCQYFVLDLTHDRHALAAIDAYAWACRITHPVLAEELWKLVDNRRKAADCETASHEALR